MNYMFSQSHSQSFLFQQNLRKFKDIMNIALQAFYEKNIYKL